MLRQLGRVLSWIHGSSLKLITTAGVVLLIWGTLSPVGTLVWWVNEGTENLGLKRLATRQPRDRPPQPLPTTRPPASSAQINCYIVYLAGVGDFSANQITPGEEFFLNGLTQAHPGCVAVSDVFPYSAANESLGGQRFLAPLWRFAERSEGWLGVADVLIKIRNLWRFAISADDRYGSIYNLGIASAVIDRMNAAHPLTATASRDLHLVLIGTSGGAQVALGAASYLDEWLDAEITVISIGGVFSGDSGFDAVEQVYHVAGRQDWIEDLGKLFPSRWVWAVNSPFNRSQRSGVYHTVVSGNHAHDGDRGYFGQAVAESDGTTYAELTLRVVSQFPIGD